MKKVTSQSKIFGKIQQAFFLEELFQYPVYGKAKFSLKFSISQPQSDYNYIQMIIRVMNRTKDIFDYLFLKSDKLYLILEFYSHKRIKSGSLPVDFKSLIDDCQFDFKKDDQYEFREVKKASADGYFYQYVLSRPVNYELFQPIVWAIGGLELGIKPSVSLKAYIVDLDREILWHLYDDRGLDIISNRKVVASQCKRKFLDWVKQSSI